MTHTLNCAEISIFLPENSNICCMRKQKSKKYINRCFNAFWFYWVLKECFNQHFNIDDYYPAKLVTTNLLKIKIF